MTTQLINPSNSLSSSVAVAFTSGTAIDFTGIPSWAKLIIVSFNGVSTNGVSGFSLQLGSGSVETTGYANATSNAAQSTTELPLTGGASAAAGVYSGNLVVSLVSPNIWAMSADIARTDAAALFSSAGIKSLAGTLDRVRIKTANGTDSFDLGSINILWG